VMLLGIGLFVVGSLLCGIAWSMPALIFFRLVQGLGAGAVQPIGMTIVGDIYSVAERAKVQGYLAGVWALASVVGPTLGGVFSDYASWRWIFFVNLPIGAAALWMFVRRFEERVVKAPHKIDVLGSLLLTAGGGLLLLGLLEGGVRWSWASPVSIALFATAVLLLLAFALVETRAAEPVLPLWVFRHRVILPAILTNLVVGVLLIGLTSYVPLFAQSVLGHGAVTAGFALAAFGLAGALLMLTVDGDSSLLHLALPCFVMGIGFGFAVAPSVIAAQSAVGWESRAVTTGSTMFARTVGSAVGVAVFGALVNASVTGSVGHASPDLEHLSPSILEPAIYTTFVCSAFVAIALVVVSLLMPRRIEQHQG
jgi:MFS family permease